MNQLPDMCPGSGQHPDEPDTCPVCDFVWVNVHFRMITPTHGLVSEQQKANAAKAGAV